MDNSNSLISINYAYEINCYKLSYVTENINSKEVVQQITRIVSK